VAPGGSVDVLVDYTPSNAGADNSQLRIQSDDLDESNVFVALSGTGVTTQCGNDVVEPGEQCDDGNTAGGDCCDANCQFEAAGSSCADGVFCNGDETCNGAGSCQPGVDPCPGQSCDEVNDVCGCSVDADCDNGLFCDGAETCDAGTCQAGMDPCAAGETCDEDQDICLAGVDIDITRFSVSNRVKLSKHESVEISVTMNQVN
jgi:cysteine-rich repeat protein